LFQSLARLWKREANKSRCWILKKAICAFGNNLKSATLKKTKTWNRKIIRTKEES
jgi:hypothetical protein